MVFPGDFTQADFIGDGTDFFNSYASIENEKRIMEEKYEKELDKESKEEMKTKKLSSLKNDFSLHGTWLTGRAHFRARSSC